jgi:cytochrome bd ubiquinol oxidase subunit I
MLNLLFTFKWKENLEKRWWLKLLAWLTPVGFLAVECGWIVTETGRQPWIIYGILRTRDSVTPMPGIQYSFFLVTFIYLALTLIVFLLMKRQIAALKTGTSNNSSHD